MKERIILKSISTARPAIKRPTPKQVTTAKKTLKTLTTAQKIELRKQKKEYELKLKTLTANFEQQSAKDKDRMEKLKASYASLVQRYKERKIRASQQIKKTKQLLDSVAAKLEQM